jgi:hypothetical protein
MRSATIALIFWASVAAAQPSAPPVIRGRVLAEENDRPLRRALVALSASNRSVRPVLTDDDGRFEIQVDTSSSLTVTKAGYASTRFTSPRQPSTRNRPLIVRMARGGVISGRIIDAEGQTAIGVKVAAQLEGWPSFEAETDDLGEYRISGLPAGRYVASAASPGTRVVTPVEFQRFEELRKQGRRLQDLLLSPVGRSRSADVRAGEETGSVDFEVPFSHGLRALAPVMRHVQVSGPPPTVSQTAPNNAPSIFIGNPMTELQGGRLLTVFGNDGPRGLDLTVSGGGTVSGTVVDSAGDPFQGIAVRALRLRNESGRTAARVVGWQRVTDDRGRYRLFGLAPGSYLVVATLDATEFRQGSAIPTGFAPLYFPGTTQLVSAQPLLVEANSDLTGTDLTFGAAPVGRITGKALDASGQPLVGRVLLNVSQRSSAISTEPRVVRTGPEGSFELIDVAPGDYVLQAAADAGLGGPAEFGSEYVTVTDRDPPPVVIATSRGATLEGRFVVDGLSEPPMRAFSLHASPVDLDRSPAGGRGPSGLGIHDDGRFYLTGLHGAMRLTVPNTLPGLYLKSITIGGVDVTDRPYDFGFAEVNVPDAEVVLSTAGAGMTGSIENHTGAPLPVSTVVVFSTNRENWFEGSRHVRRTSSSPGGAFNVSGLPPGEYFVAAVNASTTLDLQSPDTLESLVPRAARIQARENAASSVTVRLVRR